MPSAGQLCLNNKLTYRDYGMNRIFVFTAYSKVAQIHLDASIRKPINKGFVYEVFDNKFHEHLNKIYEFAKGFYAWGAQKR